MSTFPHTGLVPDTLEIEQVRSTGPVSKNLSVDDELYISYLNAFNTALLSIFPPFLMIIGILGNLVNIVVLHQKDFESCSIAIVLRFLAYMDLLVLGVIVSRYAILGIMAQDIRDFSDTFCRFHQTLQFMLTTCTNWTIVLIAIVRYITIKYPFRAPIILSVDRLCSSILSILILGIVGYIITYSQFFRKLPMKRIPYKPIEYDHCTIRFTSARDEMLHKSIQMLPETVLPSVIMFLLNMLIIIAYRDLMKKKLELQLKCISHARRLNTLRKNSIDRQAGEDSLREGQGIRLTSKVKALKSILVSDKKRQTDDQLDLISQRSDSTTPGKVVKFPGDDDDKSGTTSGIEDGQRRKRSVRFVVGSEDEEGRSSEETSKAYVKRQIQIINEQRRFRRATLAYTAVKKAENALDFSISKKIYLLPPPKTVVKDVRGYAPSEYREPRCPIRSPSLPTEILYATLLFILCNFPFCFWYIAAPLTFSRTKVGETEGRLVRTVVAILKFCGNSFNFLIYSALTEKFINEVKKVMLLVYTCFFE